jgi:hypothetical protein
VPSDAALASICLLLEFGIGECLLATSLAANADVVLDVDAVAVPAAYRLTVEGRSRSSAGEAACNKADDEGERGRRAPAS